MNLSIVVNEATTTSPPPTPGNWQVTAHFNGSEQPARELWPQMAEIVAEQMAAGKSLVEAELAAAEFLKVESQAIVPVKTGHLRDSAFVKVEEE